MIMPATDILLRDMARTEPPSAAAEPADVASIGNAQHARSPAADRVRLSRARCKRRERVVLVEVRDSEVAALIVYGFLAPDRTDDPRAIGDALGRLLDQIPSER